MSFRAVSLAAIAVAISTATAAGCRRSPLTDGKDAAADHAIEAPTSADGQAGAPDTPLDAVADLIAGDAAPGDGSPAPRDADAPRDAADAAVTDGPSDLPGADHPADGATTDGPTDRVPVDRADGASDTRPQDQPCGPLGLYCAPFACDVARGVCKSVCVSDDECTGGRPCRNGSCGGNDRAACTANNECNSGFCAQGVCCNTACNQVCTSCALPGTAGTCRPVPAGTPDPFNRCPGGLMCDGNGGCQIPMCTADEQCAVRRWCVDGRCQPCAATCASNADCASNICIRRNECSYCAASFDAGP